MKTKQVEQLILQALEHEKGGVEVYTAALQCVINEPLKEEWERYLEQTRAHVSALESVCREMGLDPQLDSPGREVVRGLGQSLVQAMDQARSGDEAAAAELVACECVVFAETKDHLDWELLGKCAEQLKGPGAEALKRACEQIEDQEDEHVYHARGWCRELWMQALGLKAVLPPPEQRQNIKTALGAARAEQEAERERNGGARPRQ